MNTTPFTRDVIAELKAAAEPAYRASAQRYVSRPIDHLIGVRTPNTRVIAAKHFAKLKPFNMADRLACCDVLIETRIFEARIVAFDWAYRSKRLYEPKHLKHFYGWLAKYVDDWNDCDDLSVHVLGEFFLKFTEGAVETSQWAQSKNRWVQRAAAVSLIPLVKKGDHLDQAFAIADALLKTNDDLLQKAYGWLLKEATRKYEPQVFAFVMQRKGEMPRTALRYAIEKMPAEMKRQAMA